jgi:type IV pilus assembly protein PilB
MPLMDLPFDTQKEEETLASTRSREEEDVANILSAKYGLPYADLSLTSIDTDALRTIPEATAREAGVACFARAGKHLSLAVENPNNPALPAILKDLGERNFEVKQFLVSSKSLEKALERYSEFSYAVEEKAGVLSVGKGATAEPSIAALKERLDSVAGEKSLERISHALEAVILAALALKASDIHFEPEESKVRLRLRLDGLLTDAYFFDTAIYHQLASRIKLLSGVKLNVADRAQDGRFSIALENAALEVRASFIPGSYGEAIVLRVLDPKTTLISFKELGINEKLLKRLETEIRRANGMLLTTGPTGSGKTTSLYAFLREIHTPDIKIITIEDPVEYHLEGIVQTQVEAQKYTFAEGLRSIVRQDPDVIMVGEIRDGETAEIAIQAALTGHFVFSTLHTNNAAGTFPRLADLGADPKSFGSAITVSMAQRLVRKLDPEHRKERAPTEAEKKTIDAVLASIVDKSLIPAKTDVVYDAVAEGENTGYHGRVGLYEAIFMDDELGAFLRDNPQEPEIAKMAAKQGYLTMAQDGVIKALAGLTTLEEVAGTVDLPRG